MAKYFTRSVQCAEIENYFGVVIAELKGRENSQRIHGRGDKCGYEIQWTPASFINSRFQVNGFTFDREIWKWIAEDADLEDLNVAVESLPKLPAGIDIS